MIWFVFVFDCDKTDDIEKDKEIYRIDGCCNIFFLVELLEIQGNKEKDGGREQVEIESYILKIGNFSSYFNVKGRWASPFVDDNSFYL